MISKELNILIAEDNGIYRKLLSAMIERITGVAPTSVGDGIQAIEQIQNGSFDLVFMDNHMPNLGGIEATQRIRETVEFEKQPYIVACTGTSSNFDLKKFEEAGIDGLLTKPFSLNELQDTIEDAAFAASVTHQELAIA